MVSVGFSTTNMWLSRFIRWLTKSKVSHTWLTFTDATLQRQMVMEASFWGFRVVTMAEFKKDSTVIAIIPPKVPLDTATVAAADWLGDYYDFEGLVGAGVVSFWYTWFKRRIKSPFHSGTALFCSESVVKVLQTANYPGAAALDALAITPEQLLEFLQAK